MGEQDDSVVADAKQVRGVSSARFVVDCHWWQDAVAFCRQHKKDFVSAAAWLTASNLLIVVAGASMTSLTETEDLTGLMTSFLVGAATAIVSLIIGFAALFIWFARLIALSHVWFMAKKGQHLSLQEVYIHLRKEKKDYLNSVGLWTSLVLLPIAFPLAVLISISILNARYPAIMNGSIFALPPALNGVVSILVTILSMVLIAYTVLSLALAGSDERLSGRKVALGAFSLMFRRATEVLLVSVAVTTVNVVLTAPQLIWGLTPFGNVLNQSVWLNAVMQVWFGLLSVILWPLSVIPYCQIVEFEHPPSLPLENKVQ